MIVIIFLRPSLSILSLSTNCNMNIINPTNTIIFINFLFLEIKVKRINNEINKNKMVLLLTDLSTNSAISERVLRSQIFKVPEEETVAIIVPSNEIEAL